MTEEEIVPDGIRTDPVDLPTIDVDPPMWAPEENTPPPELPDAFA